MGICPCHFWQAIAVENHIVVSWIFPIYCLPTHILVASYAPVIYLETVYLIVCDVLLIQLFYTFRSGLPNLWPKFSLQDKPNQSWLSWCWKIKNLVTSIFMDYTHTVITPWIVTSSSFETRLRSFKTTWVKLNKHALHFPTMLDFIQLSNSIYNFSKNHIN